MEENKTKAKIIAVAGKGGVGKTSLCSAIVRELVEAFPGKRILAIDADPGCGPVHGAGRARRAHHRRHPQ